MTPEDLLLFACARQDFLPSDREAVLRLAATPRLRWGEVTAAAERHGVAPLMRANLRRCGDLPLPPGVAERLELCYCRNVIRKRQSAVWLAEILGWFNARGIDVLLVKGAALDLLVYDHPWLTEASDIDLVLRCKRPGPLFEQTRAKVVHLYRSGVECDYFEHHDITMNRTLPVDFEGIWARARPVEIGGQRAFVMAPEDLFLSVCINGCRKRFLRLKAICDLAECAGRLSGLDGVELARRARACGCEGIVYTALLVAGETLGCRVPPGLIEGLDLHPARARLLRALAGRTLRRQSLAHSSQAGISPLLSYASYRWPQVWRSLWRSLESRALQARKAGRLPRIPLLMEPDPFPEIRREAGPPPPAR
jgi:hypothetical protein